MNRLTNNDKNWGPFTLARWKKRISFELCSGDEEDPECHLLTVGLGWALRLKLPSILKPFKGRWGEHHRVYGFSISDQGGGYDFLQVSYGPQTDDSDTEKRWGKFLPWTQWDMVRHSYYNPDGTLFANVPQGCGKWEEQDELRKSCPTTQFEFEDCDGTRLTATCKIEEREWHRGEKSFAWLKYFYPAKVRRSLDMWFSGETGPEKGSWKGGTIGTSIDMVAGESPESAFRRYCDKDHTTRHDRKYSLKFIGPVSQ